MEEARSEAAWVARRREVLARVVPPLTHDLNNALAVVTGSSELLDHSSSALGGSDFAPRIGLEARRAARTLRALSAFAKGHAPVSETIDLAEVVDEALMLLGPFVRAQGVGLEVRRRSVLARGDHRALSGAILVLGVAALGGGGATRGRLTVAGRGDRAVLRLSVEGSGTVEESDLYGLAAAAAAGGGRSRSRTRGGILVHELRLPRIEGGNPRLPPPPTSASLMVVEADDLLAELVTTVLADHGYRVRCEPALPAALEALAGCDLVILDEAAGEVDPAQLPCPVGVLAHRVGVGSEMSARLPTLLKPFRAAELVRFVEECLRS